MEPTLRKEGGDLPLKFGEINDQGKEEQVPHSRRCKEKH